MVAFVAFCTLGVVVIVEVFTGAHRDTAGSFIHMHHHDDSPRTDELELLHHTQREQLQQLLSREAHRHLSRDRWA